MYYMNALATAIDQYASHTGLTVATVSLYASGSGATIQRIRDKRPMTVQRAMRIVQWLSNRWPADQPWPGDLPRPEPSPGSPAALAAAAVCDPRRLGPRGIIADGTALCRHLHVERDVLDAVVRDYRIDRPSGPRRPGRPRRHTDREKVYLALLEAGDVRVVTPERLLAMQLGDLAAAR